FGVSPLTGGVVLRTKPPANGWHAIRRAHVRRISTDRTPIILDRGIGARENPRDLERSGEIGPMVVRGGQGQFPERTEVRVAASLCRKLDQTPAPGFERSKTLPSGDSPAKAGDWSVFRPYVLGRCFSR